jgi:hypothetical protein
MFQSVAKCWSTTIVKRLVLPVTTGKGRFFFKLRVGCQRTSPPEIGSMPRSGLVGIVLNLKNIYYQPKVHE